MLRENKRFNVLFVLLAIVLTLITINSAFAAEDFHAITAPSHISACGCDVAKSAITIRNTGNAASNYLFESIGENSELMTYSRPHMLLNPKEQDQVFTFFKVPCDTSQTYSIRTRVITGASTEKFIDQTITPLQCESLSIVAKNPSVISQACTPTVYELEFTNRMNFLQVIELKLNTQSEYFRLSQNPVILEPFQSRNVFLYLTLPCEFSESYTFSLSAEEKTSGQEYTLPLNLQINRNSYAYSFDVGELVYPDTTQAQTIVNYVSASDTHYEVCADYTSILPVKIANPSTVTNTFNLNIEADKRWMQYDADAYVFQTGQELINTVYLTPSAKDIGTYNTLFTTQATKGNIGYQIPVTLEVVACEAPVDTTQTDTTNQTQTDEETTQTDSSSNKNWLWLLLLLLFFIFLLIVAILLLLIFKKRDSTDDMHPIAQDYYAKQEEKRRKEEEAARLAAEKEAQKEAARQEKERQKALKEQERIAQENAKLKSQKKKDDSGKSIWRFWWIPLLLLLLLLLGLFALKAFSSDDTTANQNNETTTNTTALDLEQTNQTNTGSWLTNLFNKKSVNESDNNQTKDVGNGDDADDKENTKDKTTQTDQKENTQDEEPAIPLTEKYNLNETELSVLYHEMHENKVYSFLLDDYFVDPDNDTLVIKHSPVDNLTFEIDGTFIKVTPDPDFTGERRVVFTGDDDKGGITFSPEYIFVVKEVPLFTQMVEKYMGAIIAICILILLLLVLLLYLFFRGPRKPIVKKKPDQELDLNFD